jgi:subtilisin
LGIVNGYPNGTFRPNADVTRGQLSKIVANSAGFSDTPTGQQFQDVPPTGPDSTFYPYIYRLVHRGYINGYACGLDPSEPCVPPANLPYFRPNNPATRGQISKIVSNAAGFSDTPTGQQFQDVAVGSTFYDFIYRLVHRGIIVGYPCGTVPQEPCVPPQNLPYFRPNNLTTRGQMSKIDDLGFFPNCNLLARPANVASH